MQKLSEVIQRAKSKGNPYIITESASVESGDVVIANAPEVRWRETSQSLPNGLWRWTLSGDVMKLQRNTAAGGDFSTLTTPIQVDANDRIGIGGSPTGVGDLELYGKALGVHRSSADSASALIYMYHDMPAANAGKFIIASRSSGIFGIYNLKTGVDQIGVSSDGAYLFTLNPEYGGGSQVIFIKNATTVPTSNPTTGGILYVQGGALKYRGSSGTVTTIANA